MLKRVFLFLLTNIAVLLVGSIILRMFHVQPYLQANGLNYTSLLIFCAIFGFTGSIISLLLSKTIAKMSLGVQIIDQRQANAQTAWLVSTVQRLANQCNIGMPEVGIYNSPEPNAFATGWNRNNALVAVSSGLLQAMDQNEIEAVLGHEISHVANGDMVTLTLLQGVLNTFVLFFARVAAFAISQFLNRNQQSEQPSTANSMIFFLVEIVFQIVLGILASIIVMSFSRYREYRADAGSARLLGKQKMIAALQRLQQLQNAPQDNRAPSFEAMKIAGHPSRFAALFSSHPPLKDRIAALEKGV